MMLLIQRPQSPITMMRVLLHSITGEISLKATEPHQKQRLKKKLMKSRRFSDWMMKQPKLKKWRSCTKSMNQLFFVSIDLDHPEHIGDVSSFSFRSVRTFKKPLDRQCFEGVMINRSDADIKLNGKAEFHQPSEVRVVMTRQTEERTRRTPAGS